MKTFYRYDVATKQYRGECFPIQDPATGEWHDPQFATEIKPPPVKDLQIQVWDEKAEQWDIVPYHFEEIVADDRDHSIRKWREIGALPLGVYPISKADIREYEAGRLWKIENGKIVWYDPPVEPGLPFEELQEAKRVELHFAGRAFVVKHFGFIDFLQQIETGQTEEVSEWAQTDKNFNKQWDNFAKQIEVATTSEELDALVIEFVDNIGG